MKIMEGSKKWIYFCGVTSLLFFASCSVERVDICKTTATSCPGLLNAPKGMTLVDLAPATQSVTALPSQLVATFSEPVAPVEAAKFVLSGTCVNLPTISAVTMSEGDTVATASLSGGVCLNDQTFIVTVTPASVTNAAGEAGTGAALSRTYTMIALGPTATLAAPSATRIRSTDSSTVLLTYTGATSTTLSNGGVTKNAVGVNCTVDVSGASANGATLTVHSCTGNGTLTVAVNAGTATDAAGNPSTASPVSGVITVDNNGPSLVTLTPASTMLVATPATIVATFDEEMTSLVAGDFTLAGSCTSTPSKAGVVMTSGGKVATLSLSGGTCSDGQALSVTVDPTNLSDILGNAGVGAVQTRTYTVNTSGPIATLAAPSVSLMNSSGSATIALTYTGAATTTLDNTGVTKNETGVSCSVNVSGVSASGATLTVSHCSGDGAITVAVNAGTAKDSLGNNSTASAPSAAITIDNTGPALQSLTPGSGDFVTLHPEVVATFDTAMTALSASHFHVSGTCSSLPTVGTVTMGASDTEATATLVGGSCADAETVTVTVNPAETSDLAGNAGVGSATAVTYTKISGRAELDSDGDDNVEEIEALCQTVQREFIITNIGALAASVSTVTLVASPPIPDVSIIADSCSSAVINPQDTCAVTLEAKETSNGTGEIRINYTGGGSHQLVQRIEVRGVGCFHAP